MREKFIQFCGRAGVEVLVLVALLLCALAEWRGWGRPPMAYHFRGTIGGMELWEYSCTGRETAIWAEFVTNCTMVHVVVHTNTVDEYMRKRK